MQVPSDGAHCRVEPTDNIHDSSFNFKLQLGCYTKRKGLKNVQLSKWAHYTILIHQDTFSWLKKKEMHFPPYFQWRQVVVLGGWANKCITPINSSIHARYQVTATTLHWEGPTRMAWCQKTPSFSLSLSLSLTHIHTHMYHLIIYLMYILAHAIFN